MKITFSTIGCPDWSWSNIFSAAKDLGFNGIELRGISNQIYTPDVQIFSNENINNTLDNLNKANLEIPVLTSSVCLGLGDRDSNITEGKDYIDLASKLNSMVRVMINPNPYTEDININEAITRMQILCDYAADTGVTILAETNGILANSDEMLNFMKAVGRKNAGVLWDIHHPYRYFGEQPEKTYKTIKNYIKHIHVKDSIMKDNEIIYRMIGYGNIPVYDCLKLLKDGGYDGYVSLEWVKRWNPDLNEPGIVFPHFANYIKHLLEQL